MHRTQKWRELRCPRSDIGKRGSEGKCGTWSPPVNGHLRNQFEKRPKTTTSASLKPSTSQKQTEEEKEKWPRIICRQKNISLEIHTSQVLWFSPWHLKSIYLIWTVLMLRPDGKLSSSKSRHCRAGPVAHPARPPAPPSWCGEMRNAPHCLMQPLKQN